MNSDLPGRHDKRYVVTLFVAKTINLKHFCHAQCDLAELRGEVGASDQLHPVELEAFLRPTDPQ